MNQKHSVILHIIHSVAGKRSSASPLSFSTCLPSWTSNSIQRLAQPVTTMSGEMLLNCGWSCRHISGLVSGVSGGISGNLTHSDRPTQLPCESTPPRGFLKIFPKWLEIFNQFFTHLLYDPFYTTLQIFNQISPTLRKLCHTKRDHPANFLHFTRTFTSEFAYWADDIIIDVMSYPTCLLTLWKCFFYSDLLQTTINKAIIDLRKRLNVCVSADGGHFEHIMSTG